MYYRQVKLEANGVMDAAAVINKGVMKKLGGPCKAKNYGWLPQHR